MRRGLSNILAIHQKSRLLIKFDLNLSTTIQPKKSKLTDPNKKIIIASKNVKPVIIQIVIEHTTIKISIK